MKTVTYIALLTAALCSTTPQTQAYPGYMEWQPPQLTNGQNSLKVRFRAKPKYSETPSPTKRQIQLISRPYQRFIICAEYATSATTASIIPVEAGWQQGYYQLITTEPVTSPEYQHPRTCTVNEGTYPYHFLDLLMNLAGLYSRLVLSRLLRKYFSKFRYIEEATCLQISLASKS